VEKETDNPHINLILTHLPFRPQAAVREFLKGPTGCPAVHAGPLWSFLPLGNSITAAARSWGHSPTAHLQHCRPLL